jgi:hypothetical protein
MWMFFERAYPDFLPRGSGIGPRVRLSLKSRTGAAGQQRIKLGHEGGQAEGAARDTALYQDTT